MGVPLFGRAVETLPTIEKERGVIPFIPDKVYVNCQILVAIGNKQLSFIYRLSDIQE
jgi:hypothetical protein